MDELAADEALFGDAVACDLQAHMQLVAGPLAAGAEESAERLLRDLAMIEERRVETEDSSHPSDPGLRRLEAKVDLALQLLAQALPGSAGSLPSAVRLSAVGVRFDASPPLAVSGAVAVLAWRPGEGLPLSLQLPVLCLAVAGERSWWRFGTLSPTLVDLLERHVFRLHRRGLAAQRRG